MKYNINDELYLVGDYCEAHGFSSDDFPIPVTVIAVVQESRTGDPFEHARNYQEYLVEDSDGFSQWVAEEDLTSEVDNG